MVTDAPLEIVGIVKDAFTSGLDEVLPTIYFPLAANSTPMAIFRSTPGAADTIAAVARQSDARAGASFTPLSENLNKSLQASRAGAAIAEGLGAFALTLASKAYAFLRGRGYVTPQDVKSIGMDVLRHRVSVTYEAEAEEKSSETIITKIFNELPVP